MFGDSARSEALAGRVWSQVGASPFAPLGRQPRRMLAGVGLLVGLVAMLAPVVASPLVDAVAAGAPANVTPQAAPPYGKSIDSDASVPARFTEGDFRSVSCAGDFCAAVGKARDVDWMGVPIVATLSNGVWSKAHATLLPDATQSATAPTSGLEKVSCGAAGECAAVGTYVDANDHNRLFAVVSAAGVWEQPTPLSPDSSIFDGAQGMNVKSVSCSSAGECTAVGWIYYDGYQGAFMVSLVGGVWGEVVEPVLPEEFGTVSQAELDSVSCAAAGACTAVGYYGDNGSYGAMSVTSSGGVWATAESLGLPSAPDYWSVVSLRVACPSAGNCTLVGTLSDGSYNPHAVTGASVSGTWGAVSELTAPTHDNSVGAAMQSVSCTAVGDCSAVGYVQLSDYSGRSFTVTSTSGTWGTPELLAFAGGADPWSNVVGVSCVEAGNCLAAAPSQLGAISTRSTDGVWSEASTLQFRAGVEPETGRSSEPMSVSCSTTDTCVIVGSFLTAGGLVRPFTQTFATAGPPTITVTTSAPTSKQFGGTFDVAATASSELSVAITVTGGCSGSGSDSATITMTSGSTSCVVHYNQAGDADHAAAAEVTETVTASKVSTSVRYTGTQIVKVPASLTMSASTTGDGSCTAVTYALDRNPLTKASGPYQLTVVSGSVATTGWKEGVYQLSVSYGGDDNCALATDLVVVTVIANGSVASGGGYYTVTGRGRVDFGFTLRPAPRAARTRWTGELVIVNDGAWRFTATVSGYLKIGSFGTISGTGTLSWWDPTLADGAGGWALAASNVAYTASMSATTKAKPGTMGVAITFVPTGAQPATLPNSVPQPLNGGRISLS